MTWIASLCLAVLTGGLGLFLAGFVGAACVKWYHISGFEGGSGYFVVSVAFFGGVAAFFLGLVTGKLLGIGSMMGFLKGLGVAWGSVALIAAFSSGLLWLLADIPPTIGGQYLDLEVEIKMPAGQTNPPANLTGASSLTLGSVVNHVQRKSESGELNLSKARLENDRWIVPGSVRVFTMRGLRSIDARIGDKSIGGFIIPLPARPGPRFEQWSNWAPRTRPGTPPWPDSNPSYRFRIQRFIPPPPPPAPETLEAEAFAKLTADAPLDQWLPFLRSKGPVDRSEAVLKTVGARPQELAALIGSTNGTFRGLALAAVTLLSSMTPEIRDAVLADGRAIAEGLRRFNAMSASEPSFYDVQVELRGRFSEWKTAWWNVQQKMGLDGRPPVQEIHDLALVRAKDTSMDEIVINSQVILAALPPTAQAPHPDTTR